MCACEVGGAHRQRPVDAAHPAVQPEKVQQQQQQHYHQKPQRHQLKELERCPFGPTVGAVDAQEGDQQRHLQGERTTAALVSLFFEKKEVKKRIIAFMLGYWVTLRRDEVTSTAAAPLSPPPQTLSSLRRDVTRPTETHRLSHLQQAGQTLQVASVQPSV